MLPLQVSILSRQHQNCPNSPPQEEARSGRGTSHSHHSCKTRNQGSCQRFWLRLNSKCLPTTKRALWSTQKTVHRLSANSTPEETLFWLRDLKSVIENLRTTTAEGKLATLSRIVCEDLWPVAEAQFATPNATKAAKNWGYTAAVYAIWLRFFLQSCWTS